jgi:tetratricopeptide (TPR) repeat protein
LPNLIRVYKKLGNSELAASLTQRLTQEQERESQLLLARQLIDQSNQLSGEVAIELLQKALSIYEKLNYLPGKARALYGLALSYRSLNQHRRVNEVSQSALEIVQQLGANNVLIANPVLELSNLILDSYVALRETQRYIQTAPQLLELVKKTYPGLYGVMQQKLFQDYTALGETQRAEAARKEVNQFFSTQRAKEPPSLELISPTAIISPRYRGTLNLSDYYFACQPKSRQ